MLYRTALLFFVTGLCVGVSAAQRPFHAVHQVQDQQASAPPPPARIAAAAAGTGPLLVNPEVPAEAAGPWPMFRHNLQHTARTSATGPAYPALQWRYDMEGLSYSSPAIDGDGVIYAGAADRIHAVTPDGQRRWTFPVGGYALSSPALGPDGTVYIGSRDHTLYALRAADGTAVWTFTTGGEVWSSPALGPDGTVYVGSFDGHLYALDARTGAERWRLRTGGEVVSSPALSPDGTVYAGSLDGRLYAVHPDGSLKWAFATGSEIASSPALGSDGTVYAGSLDGRLHAVRPDGTPAWSQPFATGGEIVSSPALDEATVYIGSLDDHLYAVDARTGAERWHLGTGGNVISSPALDASGTVYVGSLDGSLYAVRPDGSLKWRFTADSPIWASPSLDGEGTLYIVSTGTLHASGRLYRITAAAFGADFGGTPDAGTALTVRITPPELFSPASGTLYYRRGGERTYQSTAVDLTDFTATLPAAAATPRGIEYYAVLTDGTSALTYPPFSPEARPAFQAVRVDSATADVVLPELRYKMISIPLVLEAPGIPGVLEDDYGPYDPHRWRLFRWTGDGYREYPGFEATFTPGTAFFLVTRDGGPFDVEGGRSIDLSEPYRLTLQPGWNQVGLPYAFPIAFDDIGGDVEAVGERAYYDGAEMIQEPGAVDVLRPWEGYFIRNTSDRPATLLIPPKEAPSTGATSAGKRTAARDGGFGFRLLAAVPHLQLRDTQNWVGTAADEAAGRNLLEAPLPDGHLRLSILEGPARYARHIKPLNEDGQQWDLEVRVPPLGKGVTVEVTLQAEGPLPDGFGVYVLDRDHDRAVPASSNRFSLPFEKAAPERRLRLIVGTAAYAEKVHRGITTQPASCTLAQNYPNPFNPATNLSYEIPDERHVVLEIYNVMGQTVRTLVDEVQPAARYEVIWDGLNQAGQPATSGVYFYRLKAGAFTATRKMLLLH